MNIKLNKPYKIVREKLRRYTSHYNIPAGKALIVPVKDFGDEVSCDIRWEDGRGRLHLLENKVFSCENLTPMNGFQEEDLYELWEHYYAERQEEGVKQ